MASSSIQALRSNGGDQYSYLLSFLDGTDKRGLDEAFQGYDRIRRDQDLEHAQGPLAERVHWASQARFALHDFDSFKNVYSLQRKDDRLNALKYKMQEGTTLDDLYEYSALVGIPIESPAFFSDPFIAGLTSLDFSHLEITENELITLLRHFPKVTHLNFTCCAIGDATLKAIGECEELQSVDLFACAQIPPESFLHLANCQKLVSLNVSNTAITDAELSHLASQGRLVKLQMSRANITDAGLLSLALCKKLQHLNIAFCGISAQGCQVFPELKNLQWLDISSNFIGDEGLAYIGSCRNLQTLIAEIIRCSNQGFHVLSNCTKLRFLDISCNLDLFSNAIKKFMSSSFLAKLRELESFQASRTNIDDEGLLALSNCKNLRSLALNNCFRITGDGFLILNKFTQLSFLSAACTSLSDAGLANLVLCPNLANLNIRACKVTDLGMQQLPLFPKLRTLNMRGLQQITDKGFQQLQKCLNLQILYVNDCRGITQNGFNMLEPFLHRLEEFRATDRQISRDLEKRLRQSGLRVSVDDDD